MIEVDTEEAARNVRCLINVWCLVVNSVYIKTTRVHLFWMSPSEMPQCYLVLNVGWQSPRCLFEEGSSGSNANNLRSHVIPISLVVPVYAEVKTVRLVNTSSLESIFTMCKAWPNSKVS